MQTQPALRACDASAQACIADLDVSPTSAMHRARMARSIPCPAKTGFAGLHCSTPLGSRTCMYSGKPKQKWAPMPKVAIAYAHSRAARCNAQPVMARSGNECAADYCNMLQPQSQQWNSGSSDSALKQYWAILPLLQNSMCARRLVQVEVGQHGEKAVAGVGYPKPTIYPKPYTLMHVHLTLPVYHL